MRILLVSSMYPGRDDPDFGPFVKQIADELERHGHELVRAVVNKRAGSVKKQARMTTDAFIAALRRSPDVVYAHYLFPAGGSAAVASLTARAPLVLTAHGRDVRNLDVPLLGGATRLALRRATTIIAVSDYLRRELVAKVPRVRGRVEVIDSGVDLERFKGRDAEAARRDVGWEGEPRRAA